MKQKVIIKCKPEDWFEYVTLNFRNGYKESKGEELPIEKMHKGLTFQRKYSQKAKMSKKNVDIVANLKIIECEYPFKFIFEYHSSTYFKQDGFISKVLPDGKLEVITYLYEQKLHGNKPDKHDFNDDRVKNMSPFEKLKYSLVAKEIRKKHK